ncbi:unnamed protein product [Urochloa humidicola]
MGRSRAWSTARSPTRRRRGCRWQDVRRAGRRRTTVSSAVGGDDNPPCYRTVRFGDFKHMYYNVVNLGSSLNQITNLKSQEQPGDV